MARYFPRKREEWEERFIGEFLALHYPDRPYKTKVRVGPIITSLPLERLEPAELSMVGIVRRRCDAVIYMPDHVIILEAGIRSLPGKISQLELYLKRYGETPEEEKYWTWPRKGLLVFAVPDQAVMEMAKERGFEVEYFRPSYIDVYLSSLMRRERRAPRA